MEAKVAKAAFGTLGLIGYGWFGSVHQFDPYVAWHSRQVSIADKTGRMNFIQRARMRSQVARRALYTKEQNVEYQFWKNPKYPEGVNELPITVFVNDSWLRKK